MPVARVGDADAMADPGYAAVRFVEHNTHAMDLRALPWAEGDELFAASYAPLTHDPARTGTHYLVRHADGSAHTYEADGGQAALDADRAARLLAEGIPRSGRGAAARWVPDTPIEAPEPGTWHIPATGPGQRDLDVPVAACDRVMLDRREDTACVVWVVHPDCSAHRYDSSGQDSQGPLPPDEVGVEAVGLLWSQTPAEVGTVESSRPKEREPHTTRVRVEAAPAEPREHDPQEREQELQPVAEPVVGPDFRAAAARRGAGLGPVRESDRLPDNLAALDVLLQLRQEDRPATPQEQSVLAGWTSWGALPQVFDKDPKPQFADAASRLRDMLTETEWAAARRTTINAHYTNPEVVQAVWAALEQAGFESGDVLEPGCGAGMFIGRARGDARMHGVELDPITAEIASRLYPSAHIRAESFAESPWKNETFDAVVGNVPFGDVSLYDPQHNSGNHSIHNHFIIKSLDLTRPGGVVAVLTSRYTMDAKSEAARQEMFERADLIGAVRLPTGTHQQMAGTEAVTDVLMLRKRLPVEQPGDNAWVQAVPRQVPLVDPQGDVDTEEVWLNAWWASHPEAVLGDLEVGHGMYGSQTLRVSGNTTEAGGRAWNRLSNQMSDAQDAGLMLAPPPRDWVRPDPQQVRAPVARAGDTRQFEGHLEYDSERREWTRLTGGLPEPIDVPKSQHREVLALVGLRDDVLAVLEAESANEQDTDELAQLRARLNRTYDAYVDRYGPVTRYTVSRSSRLDKFGNPVVAHRTNMAQKIFRGDPHSAVVRALEEYHEETRTATKQAIFERRVVQRRPAVTAADTPEDALAISLDTTGRVDLGHIAGLLDVEEDQARSLLGTLVFNDPARGGQLVPAAEYLSGNVRSALKVAQDAAVADPSLQVNVDALEGVQPRDLEPGEISVRLGAIWLPADDVQTFLRETLSDPTVKVDFLGGSNWSIPRGNKMSQAATGTWGTDRMDALTIAEHLMLQKKIQVTDPVDDPDSNARVINTVETEAAQAKAEELQTRLGQWAWEDPGRAQRLARIYNDTFNAIVLRSYEAEGQRLTLPGLAAGWTPHAHQRTAVARMIAEPSAGLFHAVGAGKTAEMVMGSTELRRLGLIDKPLVVVPNHMLEQFSREWLELYPQANILAASSQDVGKEHRAEFVARAATGEWDAIIMTQTAFAAIPVSAETQRSYMDSEVATVREQLERAQEGNADSRTVKRMEKQVERAEERLKKKLDRAVDPGLSFEQLGVDYLVVDEIHLYKNLTIISNIDGVNGAGSDRATDLDMKIGWLRSKAGPTGRVITGATATPIANSMAEAYVMQRYLRPDLLEEVGVTDFDAWAATFGKVVTKMEMKPAGNGFKNQSRFASFANIPELLTMWHVAADVRTTDDLTYLDLPKVAANDEGRQAPQIVAIPMTSAQTVFQEVIAERADKVSSHMVEPNEDNMLVISSDGRKAGLDVRLLREDKQPKLPFGTDTTGELTKVQVAASRIHRTWAEHRDDEFTLPGSEQLHPNRGALQIVFCDLGTPAEDRWNMYDGLRDELVGHGMDRSRIRFIHEADTDVKKARLFSDCREGRVDVLMGSTEKMGVGTNIQSRAVALHHLDCPWRPADVEQREGRIIRQGNQYPEVEINRYVTEGSFDGYMWQTVGRKARFIDQVTHGSLDQREAEDIGNASGQFDLNVITAVASGNPLLLDKAEAEAEVTRLLRLSTAHERDQAHRRTVVDNYERTNGRLHEVIPHIQQAIEQRTTTEGKNFTATVGGEGFTDRVDAAEALKASLRPALEQVHPERMPRTTVRDIAHLGGHTFDATLSANHTNGRSVTVTMRGLEDWVRFSVSGDDITAQGGHGVITRVENLASGLDQTLEATRNRITHNESEINEAKRTLGEPFPKAGELAQAKARLAQVEEEMRAKSSNPTEDPSQPGAETQEGNRPDAKNSTGPASEQTTDPRQQSGHGQTTSTDRMDRLRRRLNRNQQDSRHEDSEIRRHYDGRRPPTAGPNSHGLR